ncbi:MAG: HD domain-containing protein [Oscillospiraceae bacterium]|nr:HD domain-containing protein [Oscillospiraceae bacterium]
MTYKEICANKEVLEYYKKGNEILGSLGYTDHSTAHTKLVAERTGEILTVFGYSYKEIELGMIAGFMHDIGNALNRSHHAEYGALLANEILRGTDMPMEDRVAVVSAIANHDETTGYASDAMTAAIIIADKSDVRRSRVRTRDRSQFDIHDRVNYAVTGSDLEFSPDRKQIVLSLTIDEEICTMYDYFEIFFGRMMMCTKAAHVLGAEFSLTVNGRKIL